MISLPDPALRDGELGILLRPWGTSPEDADALALAWADSSISAETKPPEDHSREAAAKWIAGEAERRQRRLALDLVVVDVSAQARRRPAKQVLGEVGLAHFDDEGRAELGFWLLPEARGRGFGRAAVRSFTDWALSSQGPGLRQAWARIHPDNQAARGVLVHAGFARLGEVAGREIYSRAAS